MENVLRSRFYIKINLMSPDLHAAPQLPNLHNILPGWNPDLIGFGRLLRFERATHNSTVMIPSEWISRECFCETTIFTFSPDQCFKFLLAMDMAVLFISDNAI
uniref:Uncharacterized protein n=1 Tax=Spongospora subterranea TaxID=70186 RepID=A0A0H5QTH9_9EUKA|eukprot:CRZ04871.1 hypothetical protein [Spongospora subterranea]